MTPASLADSYDSFPRIEAAFQEALDESLHPRGPDHLLDLVRELGLPPQARVLDLGCGPGRYTLQLAQTFRFALLGVDPVPRNIELAGAALDEAARDDPGLRDLVRFERGSAEAVPAGDAGLDLIWCREVLYHVASLDVAFVECRRVLRPGGRMLVYHNFATDRLEPREAAWQWADGATVPENVDVRHVESAFAQAGFQIERRIVLGSEFGEYAQETVGTPGRRLVHAARLLRAPERYIARFGRDNYEIMLRDCFWHIYRMIGKLSSHVYLLRAP